MIQNSSFRKADDPAAVPASSSFDDLARILNTALVTTRNQESRDYAGELYQLMEHPAYRSILDAIRQHALVHGMSEKLAAEDLLRTFRKLDELWSGYVFQEGVSRIGSGA